MGPHAETPGLVRRQEQKQVGNSLDWARACEGLGEAGGRWASLNHSHGLRGPRLPCVVWPLSLGWSQQGHGGPKCEKQVKEVLGVQDPPTCVKFSP